MPQIFTPEHYRTAERVGVSFEGEYPEAEILAEMGLTLSELTGLDSTMSRGRDDLVAYHRLQYGGMRQAGGFAVSLLLSGDYKQFLRSDEVAAKLEPLETALPYALSPGRLSGPQPLGRFPLNSYPIGSGPAELHLPDEFADYFEGTVPARPIPARNPGPFLYPRDGVSLSYTGTTDTGTSFGQLMFSELAQYHPALVERCMPNIGRSDLRFPDDMPTIHMDMLSIEENGQSQGFIALSSEMISLGVEPAPPFGFED